MPLYKENEKNGYTTRLITDHVTHSDIFLNLTHADENWRKVVRDLRFRQALNMSIDRQEVLDAVYYGYAEMPTIVPDAYDLDKARALLDEMGLDKMDAEGYRLGPDGNTFTIPFELGGQDPTFLPVAELVVSHWKEIGVKATLKSIDGNLWGQRNGANELQATILFAHLPLWYMGDLGQGLWGPLWIRWWNSQGQDGEEPPDDVKQLYTRINEINVVPPEQGRQVYQEVRQMIHDNVYFMPPVERVRQAMITNARYGNVPDTEEAFGIAVDFSAEQFYLKS
jgi:peptide/nickel transport system substrate-binding protein